MKIKNLIEAIIVILIIFIVSFLKYSEPKIESVKLKESNTNIQVPSSSKLKQECCMYSVTFKTFKSVKVTKKKLDEIVNSFEKITVDGKTYYYDSKNDISIDDYGVDIKFPFNEFYFSFSKGRVEEKEETN